MELPRKVEDMIYNPWIAVPAVLSGVVGAIVGIAIGFYGVFQLVVMIGAR